MASALARLEDVEGGYRGFHSLMTGIAREFPRTVLRANAAYHIDLCGLMQVWNLPGGLVGG